MSKLLQERFGEDVEASTSKAMIQVRELWLSNPSKSVAYLH